jgi:hypothetical protein
MDREIPFEKDTKCDIYGKLGAFDFMGDYICERCLKPEDTEKLRVWIEELKAENIDLKQKATYWEAKANEYKAILENMERVEHYPHTTNSG